MNKKRLVVIGGDAAGMSASSQAKRRCPEMAIVVFERGPPDQTWSGGLIDKPASTGHGNPR